ncbi:STAS domain-containing protein [Azonexus sp. IMCC34842]|uniref:STAS domain-containing protein n=1 Tax=Azonexus sp. IMCC34842 TaxID=3420950 RepID=UPI003D12647E
MPERPAARPRPAEPPVVLKQPEPEAAAPLAEPLPDLEFTNSNPAPSAPLMPLAVTDDFDFSGEDFDRDFTESSVMAIDVEQGGDPVQADIEQVVVMFANSQDAPARALLEMLIRSYSREEGMRFWRLLFDLLQATGDRAAFEKLGFEFAEACETSPPTWRQEHPAPPTAVAGPRIFVLQGVLTGDGAQPVAELAKLVDQKIDVRVDCGKLVGCDDDVAGELAALLRKARRTGVAVDLEHVEGFIDRLNERLVAGEATRATAWLLLLELLQRHGTQDTFEERAVDYAVTFELSPPSWETLPAKHSAVPKASERPRDEAYYLSGELKNCRFDELVAMFEAGELTILDFSAVRRMDFFSAGQLVNRIAPFKAKGCDIVIRSPNHLVAELMAVVGLNKQARIIVPKF